MATITYTIVDDKGRLLQQNNFDIADVAVDEVHEAVYNAIVQSGEVIDEEDSHIYDGD